MHNLFPTSIQHEMIHAYLFVTANNKASKNVD